MCIYMCIYICVYKVQQDGFVKVTVETPAGELSMMCIERQRERVRERDILHRCIDIKV